jgi:phosphonate transport system substrate-binding protein
MLLTSHVGHAEDIYTFGIVPQQSPVKTVRTWAPLIGYLTERTGARFHIKTAKDIPTFEEHVLAGSYDFAYMNPAHYVAFSKSTHYQALAKARDKKIQGILVVRKDSPIHSIQQLHGSELAFPAPGAFAATLLNRSELMAEGVLVKPSYVASHDSVYLNVAAGRYPAGGGVIRTLRNMPQKQRDQLRILHTTKPYTPHAIAAHPRVPSEIVQAVQSALAELHQSDGGSDILHGIKIKGFEAAEDADWDDVRALKLDQL